MAGSFASTTVAADRAGNLWLGTWRGGLYRLKNGALESQPTPLPTLYFTVRALAFDASGNHGSGNQWIGNWAGLFQFDGKRYHHFASEPDSPYRRVSAILFTRTGELWVGTADHGVFHFHDGRPTVPAPPPLLPDSEITSLLEGSDATMWVGTSKGLVNLRSANPVSLSRPAGLPDEAVESIFEDSRNRIWASTSEGAISVISPSGVVVLDRKNGLPGQPSTGFSRLLGIILGQFFQGNSRTAAGLRSSRCSPAPAKCWRSSFTIRTMGCAASNATAFSAVRLESRGRQPLVPHRQRLRSGAPSAPRAPSAPQADHRGGPTETGTSALLPK